MKKKKQQQRNLSPGKKEVNNNERIEPEIRQISSFPMPNVPGMSNNSNFSGPMLPNPFQGIPGNPIHQQIQGVQPQTSQNSESSEYICRGGIFD